jgi:hypothetical protein
MYVIMLLCINYVLGYFIHSLILGQMGIGITMVAATSPGIPVILLDSNKNQLDKQMQFLGRLNYPSLVLL